ncbi:chemotaxis protein CheB [Streptomyces sp. NPDC001401]|uniref:chemotaxis protein CheB n=1 Tax=Streptomyces sp. NPDC001401 TaxID=3364570 RepID=UPI0036C57333
MEPATAPPADGFEAVAVASSAGGITGLVTVLGALDADLPVPVLVVQHLDPRHRTVIAEVLGRRTPLPVKLAADHERTRPGTVYIAPPDRHLLVRPGGRLALTDSELVHFVRPSADLLFESVAGAYGPRAIACVLTGTGRDGAMGVDAVKSRGGTVIVQDPATAEFSGMPEAAVGTGTVDFVLPLEEIAAVIRGLVETKRQ